MNNSDHKILFIIPTFFFQENYHKDLFYSELPIKTLQVSAILKKRAKISTDFLDLRFEKELLPTYSQIKVDLVNFEEKLIKLLEHNFIEQVETIFLIMDSSYQFLQTVLIANILKKKFPAIRLIVAGQHPTAMSVDFSGKRSEFDMIIVGEPESAISELINFNYFSKTKKLNHPSVIHSSNMYDLNKLPFPDYSAYLTKYDFRDFFHFTIHASRGCPFHCSFCKIMRTRFRNFSFTHFIKRFEQLQKIVLNSNPSLPKISFLDQSYNSAILGTKILHHIIENKLNEIFNFTCQTRIEIIAKHKELLELFQKARMVPGFGLESANKQLLLEMKKTRNPTNYLKKLKEILEFYKSISEPYCRINTLAGFPGEDSNTFDDTIRFLKNSAFHENIQISPSLFINDPICSVYDNMAYYEQTYGTIFQKEWWMIQSDPLKNAVLPKPSKNYSKLQLIDDYKEKYLPLLTEFRLSPFKPLVHWKTYHNKWKNDLIKKN
ncbi:MAG: hypothetical protein BAJALOKI1v1_200007 [Promethearchaeota archaeon]|nr:MAG: hypothetical protein BAJALOKI1v1_200007 [Candidatus Lokiarchaeota archaeon]